MENIFGHILQMSFYGSIAVMAVLILRKFFVRLPKKVTCLFWLVPGIRLLCPLNFSTIFSVMNVAKLPLGKSSTVGKAATTVLPKVSAMPHPTGFEANHVTDASGNLSAMTAADPKTIMAYIWLAGVLLMLAYLTVRTVNMLIMLRTAKKAPGKRYYESDVIDTSFVLGIFNPRIYMQSGLSEKEESYILLHEQTHIKYKDHITRIIGVLTICLHWFNPLVWIAFAKMCADLEMRCDETVVERMGAKIRMDYCRSIVNHALERDVTNRGLSVAFSGDNYRGREIKMRVKNLINYKKVSTIVAVFAAIFALGLTAILSTKAQAEEKDAPAAATGVAKVTAVPAKEAEYKKGEPVSVPGNILLDMPDDECLANYGKENFALPDDIVYSDEGRPYSKTYDYKTTPALNRLGSIVEKAGFEIPDRDMEFLDRDGNTQVGRELYCMNAWKENGDETMLLNFYMVSEEYALDSYNEKEVRDGLWIGEDSCWTEDGTWYTSRIYDTRTGVMMDAQGTYEFDWEALGLFDTDAE